MTLIRHVWEVFLRLHWMFYSRLAWRRMDETMWPCNYASVRSHHDIPLRYPVPVRRLGNVPLKRRRVFHLRVLWNVLGIYHCEVLGTYHSDVVTTLLYDMVERYQWDILATYHWDIVRCFIWYVTVTSLGRIKRRRQDVARMSSCRVGNDAELAFKNCVPFSTCKTVINDVFVDRAEHIYIAIPT